MSQSMKHSVAFLCSFLLTGGVALAVDANETGAAPVSEVTRAGPPEIDDEALIYFLGTSSSAVCENYELTDDEVAMFMRGVLDGLAGEALPLDPKVLMPKLRQRAAGAAGEAHAVGLNPRFEFLRERIEREMIKVKNAAERAVNAPLPASD